MTFTHALSTNNYGCAKFIVDASAANGTHTTIASAITSASSGDTIFIRPGTYTENLTLKAGVNLAAYITDSSNGTVTIVGKMTSTFTGTVNISGIRLQTNSDFAIESTGSNAAVLSLDKCFLNCTNSTGISGSNTNARVTFSDSGGNLTTTGIAYFASTGLSVGFIGCALGNTGGSTTANTISAGTVTVNYSTITNPTSLTGTSNLNSFYSSFNTSSQNVTTLTINSSGSKFSHYCIFSSGSAVAITVTSGTYQLTYSIVSSTNATAAIDGAGVLASSNINFGNSANVITTTTQDMFPLSADGMNVAGTCSNLGITYVVGTGVFSVNAANGSALSITNPGYVSIAGKTTGVVKRYIITSNQAFIDDNGASEIITNLFGYTTGVAVGVDVPFFIYAVVNDAETSVQFMLSRQPHRKISPAAANIGAPDDPVADAEGDFWSFDNIDETLYESNPCVCIGSFRMRMSASDDWTVQTLAITDGIGQFQENVAFTQPLGQFGADTGALTVANGGTSPVFSSISSQYFIQKNGWVWYNVFMSGDGGTDGSGAVNALITTPYLRNTSSVNTYGHGASQWAGGNLRLIQYVLDASNTASMRVDNTSAGGAVTWSLFTNGGRNITATMYYKLTGS